MARAGITMGIVNVGLQWPLIQTDTLSLLEIDHEAKATDWHTKSIEYFNGRQISHVWPNKGAHTYAMKTEDGLDQCICTCPLEYDVDDSGEIMVIHSCEKQLSTG